MASQAYLDAIDVEEEKESLRNELASLRELAVAHEKAQLVLNRKRLYSILKLSELESATLATQAERDHERALVMQLPQSLFPEYIERATREALDRAQLLQRELIQAAAASRDAKQIALATASIARRRDALQDLVAEGRPWLTASKVAMLRDELDMAENVLGKLEVAVDNQEVGKKMSSLSRCRCAHSYSLSLLSLTYNSSQVADAKNDDVYVAKIEAWHTQLSAASTREARARAEVNALQQELATARERADAAEAKEEMVVEKVETAAEAVREAVAEAARVQENERAAEQLAMQLEIVESAEASALAAANETRARKASLLAIGGLCLVDDSAAARRSTVYTSDKTLGSVLE